METSVVREAESEGEDLTGRGKESAPYPLKSQLSAR